MRKNWLEMQPPSYKANTQYLFVAIYPVLWQREGRVNKSHMRIVWSW